MIQDCWIAFLVGGLLCAIGQVLIDYTKLTPARILTGYVVAGVLLSAVGLYPKLIDWAGGGASVPLTGFGNLLAWCQERHPWWRKHASYRNGTGLR